LPFLRWAGSKRGLVPLLRSFWKVEHKRYVEPFAGSACLFFAIAPPRAILGDLNRDLILTYTELKYRREAVLRELATLPIHSREAYRTLRSLLSSDLPPSLRAARFIYLNRYCFNGIYRTNLAGQFNVPYSGDRCGRMPADEVFRKCARRLRNARLVPGDFEKVLRLTEKGDFVYMDPPYAVRARRVFKEYAPGAFTHADISRLRLWMERLHAGGVSFVVSYADSDEANLLKKGFSHQTLSVPRNVAGFAANRIPGMEVLITNT
jgi:DNA adenine methylase